MCICQSFACCEGIAFGCIFLDLINGIGLIFKLDCEIACVTLMCLLACLICMGCFILNWRFVVGVCDGE